MLLRGMDHVRIARLQMLIERGGWAIIGVLVFLFLAWRFLGNRIKQRIRQDRHGAGERVQSCNEVSLRAAREVQKVPNRDEENNHAPSPRCASTSNSTRRMPNASIRRVSLRGEVHVPDSGMSQQLLSV